MSAPLNVLQLVGSPTSEEYRELSELYARGCLAALHDPSRYYFIIAHVDPSGAWRFPASLDDAALEAAATMSLPQAVATLANFEIDIALPQMFCPRGMTDMRALLDLLAIPYIGNRPLQMAVAADKSMAKAIVAAVGVDVPRGQLLRAGERPAVPVPAVVKPNTSDNSAGVSLVRAQSEYVHALDIAFEHSDAILVETYIDLGREVRCGVVERRGELICLPLEEYFVDHETRPIRRAIDKLKRDGAGDLMLAAKTKTESWIVRGDDPVVPAVWAAARTCYRALDSRHYNLFDFRIDRDGRPWFLESGPYCSFAPSSVLVTMMEAAGTPLARFFADSISDALGGTELTIARDGAHSRPLPSNAR